ncbi:unnamed protein product [Sphacelaria rigidula]
MILHAVVIRPLTSHPYETGTEHAWCSPDLAHQVPCSRRRWVWGFMTPRAAASPLIPHRSTRRSGTMHWILIGSRCLP